MAWDVRAFRAPRRSVSWGSEQTCSFFFGIARVCDLRELFCWSIAASVHGQSCTENREYSENSL
jgi:hypothetical protein